LDALERWDFLDIVTARENLLDESGQLITVLGLYDHLRKEYSDEKMIIFFPGCVVNLV
jgi:hypothetical protein